MISIIGLDKAAVLAALYNASYPQGMEPAYADPQDMSIEEAREILKVRQNFEYLEGRVMKVHLASDTEFEEYLYDRDNGNGAAKRVVEALRVGTTS